MRLLLIAVLLLVWTGLGVVSVGAQSQESYRPLRVTLPASVEPGSASQFLWAASISPQAAFSGLTLADDLLVARIRGHICALASNTGLVRWCSQLGRSAAYANGTIAYVRPDLSIVGVDLAGRLVWRLRAFTSRASDGEIWSTGSSFIVSYGSDQRRIARPNYGEVSADGRLLWSQKIVGTSGVPSVARPYALQRIAASGATIKLSQVIVRLGNHGGVKARLEGAYDVLNIRAGRALVLASSFSQEPADAVITTDVQEVELDSAAVVADAILAPDYRSHLRSYRSGKFGSRSNRIVAAGDAIYIAVNGATYRYANDLRKEQRPLLIDESGTFVGLPVEGTVFVAHADGIWALTPRAGRLEVRRIISSHYGVTAFGASASTAYFVLGDRRVYGVDVRTGSTVLAGRNCSSREIDVGRGRVYFVCRSPDRVLAYRAPE